METETKMETETEMQMYRRLQLRGRSVTKDSDAEEATG